jgi:hypothetical protein
MTQLSWISIKWPREISTEQLATVARLIATTGGKPIVVEAVGQAGMVHHQVGVVAERAGAITRQLRAALPGAAVTPGESLTGPLDRAVALRLNTRRRTLRSNDGEIGRALLAALSATGKGERVVLQWTLGKALHPEAVPSQLSTISHESWFAELLALPFGTQKGDGELRKAMADKRSEPGWRAAGRLAVHAESDARRYQLIRGMLSALRLAESPGATLLVHRTSPRAVANASRPWHWPLRLNATELSSIAAWPSGSTIDLPVNRSPSRTIPPSKLIPRRGRVVARSTASSSNRPLALSVGASLKHLHAIGPTGVGKSTLLLNLIAQDIESGRSVVVVEPKGDLIADILARIPPERVNDVVLIDPSDSTAPVGLNPLALMGRPPELVADQLLSVFRQLSVSWGPRLEQILHASLLTLAKTPGSTLVNLPLLLSDDGYRRKVTRAIHDPVALTPFWHSFEQWTPAERANAIAPVMNRLLPFLQRPQLRAMLGQSRPKFDVNQVFTGRKIVLVNLAKGLLGPSTASLLGGLIISQLWQAALGRAALAPERRHPVFITLDEFQDYLALPTDLSDALSQARGLGVGFALAHQHLHQLDPTTRASTLANARNRVAFQLAADDARAMAGTGGTLDAEDFTSLAAFECYVQLVADDAVQPWASGRTLPPPDVISNPDLVRAASQVNYGTPIAEVNAEIEALVTGNHDRAGSDLGPRPRRRAAGTVQSNEAGGDS